MSEPILSVKNLSAGYGGRDVISDITFDLRQGEILGIVGESGSGKSTLLKTVLPVWEGGTVLSDGTILFKNIPMTAISASEKKKLCGVEINMIYQNPKTSFNPIRSFRKQFIETLKSHGRYKKEYFEDQVLDMFHKLHLPEGKRILDSCPFEMSGGMNQRIAIALAILLEPRLLLADEPTSALDVTAQQQVMDQLLRIRKYYQTSIIIVTHNMDVVSRISDRAGVMYQGKIVELGLTKQVFTHPEHPYTQKLLNAIPHMGDRHSEKKAECFDELLKLHKVSKRFKKNKNTILALSKVDLQLKPGELLGIVGMSGSGKSTLLKQIAGLQEPTAGTIFFKGKPICKKRTKEEFRGMQMIFQNSLESFNPRLKIRYSIEETLKNLCGIKSRKERDARINRLMKKVGLKPELADKYPHELSGGQCQRAAIARAICVSPDLLLCDEITSALDAPVQAEIIKLLSRLAKDIQMSIIFVSHDIVLVSNLCETMMVMNEGRCIETGSAREIITNPKKDDTRRLLASAMER